jgi:dihydrodipicolinate synthase/N-acetylneuraminate lyase
MQRQKITGVVPILVTPFDESGKIDEASLRRLIEFNIAGGVHGLGVALGSEIFKLSDSDREVVVRCVVDTVRRRVPVVINTGAAGTDVAVYHSKAAQDAGADALMVLPPTFIPVPPDGVVEYYRQISRAVRIPIFLQDAQQGPIPPGLAMRIAEACENVHYIKVETVPVTMKVKEMVAAVGKKLTVFGGAGGTYFIEEMRRGSQGTMPYCSQPTVFVEVWDRFQHGDEPGARELFDRRIMAINRLTAQGYDIQHHVHKQLLVRQGIIRTAKVRGPTVPPDPLTQNEIDRWLTDLVPTSKAFMG